MGSDIHGVFQRKTASGEWVDIPSAYEQQPHYALFAWLGDVRNGFGFAGCPTHERITPLSYNRGLPDDFLMVGDDHPLTSVEHMVPISRKYRQEGEPLELWMGDHSFSWVTADEVLSAELPCITRFGVVDRSTYEKWDGSTPPEEYCGSISGPTVVVSDPESIVPETTHVRIRWFVQLTEEFAYFINEVRRLKDEYGDVRFVFGFDS